MRSFVFNICFYVVTFFTALIALIAAQFGGQKTVRWFLRRHCKNVFWMVRNILGSEIEVRGLERYKNKPPALIVSKHQSELDVFQPLGEWPELGAIAMEELTKYPLLGPVLRKLDYILVSVEGARKEQLSQVVSGSKRVSEEGRPILIYPEGELMRIGARERYRSGVFHIYEALGCEATPVALSCGLVWPKREWRKFPRQKCVIEYMDPIPAGLDRDTFMVEIERRIEGRCMELLREHGPADRVANAEERHLLGLTNEDDAPRRPPIPGLTDAADMPASDAK